MNSRRPPFGGALALALAAALVLTGCPARARAPQKQRGRTPGRAVKPPQAAKTNALDPVLKEAIASAPSAEKWPNNNSALLRDFGSVTLRPDGTVVAEYRIIRKLFNERARNYAEVSLSYNTSYQDVKLLHARTIQKSGKVIEVKQDDVRFSSPYSDYALYDDTAEMGFSLPGVEDNCIVDYSWRQVTRPYLMPGRFWEYWSFSSTEPVGLSRYVLRAPADKTFQCKIYNDDTLKPTVVASSDGRVKTWTWERKDLKPIEREPEMPPISDVMVWMELSSIGAWQDIARWFWDLQKPQAAPNAALRDAVPELTADKKTDEEKARALYDFVADRVRYVGVEFGVSAYRPHAAAEVHGKLYGDCKDKATLLIAMLGLAGVKAHPVLLRAGDRRPVGQGLPTLRAFNHCIALAEVDGEEVWLDATAETCAYGDIPPGDRGAEALVVRDGAGRFQKIPSYMETENGMEAKNRITLDADGGAAVEQEILVRGAAAHIFRALVKTLTPEKRQEIMKAAAQRYSAGETLTASFMSDAAQKEGPFVMKMTMNAPNYATKTGSLLIVPFAGGANSFRANPFLKEKRVWPFVEEESGLIRAELTLAMPEGYAVEEIPEDVTAVCPILEYRRTFTKSADGKTVTASYVVRQMPGVAPASDLAKMRAYYDAIRKTADDKVVLKRIAKP